MEAVLLVGGQGRRLRPMTLTTPKPMLPVANHPCTAHQIALLKKVGVTRVVLGTSYKADVFKGYFGHGENLGIEIEYVTESSPLGTGGAIRNVASALQSAPDEPVVILNGDILTNHNIAQQVEFHRAHKADVTLHLREVADPRAFGLVETDGSNRVTAFIEKPEIESVISTHQINAGCYVFNRSVIDEIPEGRVVSVERETFPDLLSRNRIVMGYVENAYWLDLGNPLSFVQGSRDVVLGVCASPLISHPGNALVSDSATVATSAVISHGSAIGDDVVIGDNCTIEGSVVMAGAQVMAGSVLRNSLVGADAVIGASSQLDGAVVADVVDVPNETLLHAGEQVFPDHAVILDGTEIRTL